MTSKLKSSLMLFIFKCSLLDRRHLVWHSSRGRPWCSALHGSITRRQPFCADTKGVGLTRDSLWNLSQSCTTMKKTQLRSAPCLHTSRSVAMLPSHLSICHHARLFAPPPLENESPLKIFFFFFPEINVNAFNVWKACLLSQMLKHRLYVPDLDDVKLWRKECIYPSKILLIIGSHDQQLYRNVLFFF